MRAHGFTLIEVLVAVAIIAAMALAIGLGLSGLGGTRQLEREAERLQAHLAWACEAAELDSRAIGLRQTARGYEFLERHDGAWRAVRDQDALAAHRLPAGTTLELVRDGERLPVAADTADTMSPQLACFPSGELTPFVASLAGAGADRRYRVEGSADGHITLAAVDAPR